jgi:hypothetical protein
MRGVNFAGAAFVVTPATAGMSRAQGCSSCHNSVAAITPTKPVAYILLLDVKGRRSLLDYGEPAITLAGFVFKRARELRGIIGLHQKFILSGVMPWDCSRSRRGASIGVVQEKLYHMTERMYITTLSPWSMQGRALAELGIDADAIVERYTGK